MRAGDGTHSSTSGALQTSGHILLTDGFLGSCEIKPTQTLALALGNTPDGVFRPLQVC